MLLEDNKLEEFPQLYIQSNPITIQRLKDRRPATIEAILAARRVMGNEMEVLADAWTIEETPGPNVTDKESVLTLGYMTYDAYYIDESSSEWHDVGHGYNRSLNVGWEKNGLRGHVFTNEDNSTVVIGLKGTTPGMLAKSPFTYVFFATNTKKDIGTAIATLLVTTKPMITSLGVVAVVSKVQSWLDGSKFAIVPLGHIAATRHVWSSISKSQADTTLPHRNFTPMSRHCTPTLISGLLDIHWVV